MESQYTTLEMKITTPENKAVELVCTIFRKSNGISKWHLKHDPKNWEKAKKCALVAVEEILKIEAMINDLPLSETKIIMEAYLKFWRSVKYEIEKLKSK